MFLNKIVAALVLFYVFATIALLASTVLQTFLYQIYPFQCSLNTEKGKFFPDFPILITMGGRGEGPVLRERDIFGKIAYSDISFFCLMDQESTLGILNFQKKVFL